MREVNGLEFRSFHCVIGCFLPLMDVLAFVNFIIWWLIFAEALLVKYVSLVHVRSPGSCAIHAAIELAYVFLLPASICKAIYERRKLVHMFL